MQPTTEAEASVTPVQLPCLNIVPANEYSNTRKMLLVISGLLLHFQRVFCTDLVYVAHEIFHHYWYIAVYRLENDIYGTTNRDFAHLHMEADTSSETN